MSVVNFLIGPFLVWLPVVVLGAAFLFSVLVYFFRDRLLIVKKISKVVSYDSLALGLVAFWIFYAAFKTGVQYYVWSNNPFSQLLLPPNQSISYFATYVGGRFWLNVVLAVGVAFAFYFFLQILKKYKSRFFAEGETELGLVAALIVGWPNFAVFIPLVFISIIIISLFRRLVLKNPYTTLGASFLLSVLVLMLWGSELLEIMNLEVLRI